MKEPIYIVDGVRTPFAKAGTTLADSDAMELGKTALRLLVARTGIDPSEIEEVIIGCVSQPADSANVGRVVALRAGIPDSVPAITVHRNCASGFEAVTQAAEKMLAGRGEVFAQMFSVDADLVRPLDSAAHLSPAAVLEKYASIDNLIWAGEGAQVHAGLLGERARADQIVWNDRQPQSSSQSAGWMLAPRRDELAGSIAALAFAEYRAACTTRPADLRAIYVRPSDAEINEQWQSEKSQPSAQ